jgi:predicted phage terminase large subunit-like protein
MPSNSAWTRQLRVNFDAATRNRFSLYFRQVMQTVRPGAAYLHNWHIDAISAYLSACERGEISRLIINLPPRMLKSTLVSVAWPAWLLGHRPQTRVMAASYAQSLSIKHSLDCRAVMEAEWYRRVFAQTVLCRGQTEKEKFVTTARGYRLAVSVGGAAIGEGGDILIVDDPINPLQAMHCAQREGVNQWFDHTFVTRLDDKQHGAIVVVMQRLHVEDLSGYLLAKGGWEHLCLPSIAPVDSRIGYGRFQYRRIAGEVLHAMREPLAVIERTKRELGSANFSAQYQQAPVSYSGRMIAPHWCVRFLPDAIEGASSCVQSWDTGIKAGAKNDASACATFRVKEGVHYLVDMTVVRLEYPALKRLIVSHAARFSPDAVLIEDKASGQSLLQDFRQDGGLPVISIMPTGDKLTRVMQITPMLEAGKVALPQYAPWLADFEAEFFTFPDGAHDDQTDAVSQYLNWVRSHVSRQAPTVRRL